MNEKLEEVLSVFGVGGVEFLKPLLDIGDLGDRRSRHFGSDRWYRYTWVRPFARVHSEVGAE